MKILALIALLASYLGAGSLAAQTLKSTLRAGEHMDFTRIVLTNEAELEWSITERPMEFDLVFKDKTVEVDLSQAFDRIPRTRIRDMLPISGGLRVIVACPCPIRIVEGIGAQIVVDVVSSPKASHDNRPSDLRPEARPEPRNPEDIPWRAGIALADQVKTNPSREGDTSALQYLDTWLPIAPATAPEELPKQTEITRQNRATMTDLLVSTISRAVAQNTLVAASDFIRGETNDASNFVMPRSSHIGLPEEFEKGRESAGSQNCSRAVSALNSDWSQSTTHQQSSILMSSLFNPLDQFQIATGKALISYFLNSGMGAEARMIIHLLSEEEWHDAALNVSFLLDGESVLHSDILSKHYKCSDEDSLWAFLENPKGEWIDTESLRAVLRGLLALNQEILSHVGLQVIKHLVDAGYENEVMVVKNALGMITVEDVDIKKNDVTISIQEVGSSLIKLPSGSFDDISDSDILLILKWANEEGRALPIEILKLAQDRQFIHRRGTMAENFTERTAIALAFSDEFSEAFNLASTNGASPEGLRTRLLEILLSNADDPDFLTSIYEQRPWALADLPPDLKLGIGHRLEELGFTEDASRIIESVRTQKMDQSAAPLSDEGGATMPPAIPAAGDTRAAAREAVADVKSSGGESGRTAATAAVIDAAGPILEISPAAENRSSPAPVMMPELDLPSAARGLLSQSRAALSNSEALRDEMLELVSAGSEDGSE